MQAGKLAKDIYKKELPAEKVSMKDGSKGQHTRLVDKEGGKEEDSGGGRNFRRNNQGVDTETDEKESEEDLRMNVNDHSEKEE